MRQLILVVSAFLVTNCGPSKSSEQPVDKPAEDPDLVTIRGMLDKLEPVVDELCACTDNACKAGVMTKVKELVAAEEARLGARFDELEAKTLPPDLEARKKAIGERGASCAPELMKEERCAAEEKAAQEFVAANKACTSDKDCASVAAGCYQQQEDCCVVYLNTSAQLSEWQTLTAAIKECRKDGCDVCCAKVADPPKCNEGICGR